MIDLHKMVWAYENARKQHEWFKKQGKKVEAKLFEAIIESYETKLKELTNAAA